MFTKYLVNVLSIHECLILRLMPETQIKSYLEDICQNIRLNFPVGMLFLRTDHTKYTRRDVNL